MASVECVFGEDGECHVCGYKLRKAYRPIPRRVCGDGRCCHQGVKTGGIKIGCAGGKAEVRASICVVHGRCLPHYRPNKRKWEERHESSLYHLCYNCKEFKAKE